jgi:peptide/nickel transport system permease protein
VSSLKATARGMLNSPTGLAGLILLAFFLVIAIIGPSLWGVAGSRIDPAHAFAGPSSYALMGTDQLGRDVLLRTLAASRLSLELAVAAVAIAVVLGVPSGAAVGFLGPRMRRLTGSAIQYSVALPPILVALFVVAIIGPGAFGATIAIGLALVPLFARTTQTLASSIAESEYLAAARVLGLRRRRLLWRHILPNAAEPLVLLAGVGATVAIVLISALSFLGLGVQTPSYDWGRVLNDGLQALYTTPTAAITPGVAIVLAGLMFTFLGEALARSLSPALRLETRRQRPARDAANADAGVGGASPARPGIAGGEPVMAVENLHVGFSRGGRVRTAVAGVSLAIQPGEIVGVVGESGAGKSMMALSLAGLAPGTAEVSADSMRFNGVDLLHCSRRERRRVMATDLSVIFQDPMSSLNPALRVGRQLSEKVEIHFGMSRREAFELAERRLTETDLPAARERLRQYPHEYSGGMRQRAMIAMGLMTDPALIIADEPTTALDVTVQAQILDLLREINARTDTAVLLISHDVAVVSELCTRVIVMYAGRLVEQLTVEQLEQPAHPYTRALLGTLIDLDTDCQQPLVTIPGQPPALGEATVGCPFAGRCSEATDRCHREDPPLEPLDDSGHAVACWARSAKQTVVQDEAV